jgi:hypothetical protein
MLNLLAGELRRKPKKSFVNSSAAPYTPGSNLGAQALRMKSRASNPWSRHDQGSPARGRLLSTAFASTPISISFSMIMD